MESNIKLYNDEDLEIMKLAYTCKSTGTNRIEQIKKFAVQAGYKKIGIAYCVSVKKYANQLENYLADDFDVVKVDCKCAKMPSEIFVEQAQGISCNPAGQAKILEVADTDFNITLGLCLGHDIIFSNKSKAPVTTLIVKDAVNKHNVIDGFDKL